jgi:arsenate reductase-like glutaredoxin family protein
MNDSSNKGKPNQMNVKTTSPDSEEFTKSLAKEAKELRGTLGFLTKRLEHLSVNMEKAELSEYVNLMQRPWQLIWRNFISGLSRGVGIALGFTFFAATIVYLLQFLGALNLPVVGGYIANIVRIVQRQLQINPY